MSVAQEQVPGAGGICLDHVAHWVPGIDAATERMQQLGFTLTPYSSQRLPPKPGEAPAPAGTGNRCIMLRRGYIEVLTVEKGAETPNARSLREGMARYVGLHIVCFGASDPEAVMARLTKEGFDPPPAVALSRTIGTMDGEGLARFSVVRAAPGKMPEGRIQYCIHHTPELLWQDRWIDHPNGAEGLEEVTIQVADVAEARARYRRFLGRKDHPLDAGFTTFLLDRSMITLAKPPAHAPAPTLPFVAGYRVRVKDLSATKALLARNGVAFAGDSNLIRVEGGPAIGATITFC